MAGSILRRLFFCTFGKHTRSRGKAYEVDGDFQSQCKYCGIVMHKTASGKWVRR
jgi:hypothetical protein